jgi:DNA-binding MarR family transcriptional regulator
MNLTPREKVVIDFLREKKSGKEIADKLGTKQAPSELLTKLKRMKMIERLDISHNEVFYRATPWQNRPCVLGVRL